MSNSDRQSPARDPSQAPASGDTRPRRHVEEQGVLIRPHPLISDLQQHQSTSNLSTPPSLLQGSERNNRRRDTAVDPFLSISKTRSKNLDRQRHSHNSYNLCPPHYTPSFVNETDTTPPHGDARATSRSLRQVSGGFWTVGGRLSVQLGQLHGINAGTGGLLASGTNAPLHTATFLDQPTPDDKTLGHERRLALALEIDQASRILPQDSATDREVANTLADHSPFVWRDNSWTRDLIPRASVTKPDATPRNEKAVPTVPFRVLDAPNLKDDYYCSILAYSYTCHTLAVALTQKVYLWTEQYGVRYPPLPPARPANFVTSLAFSSDRGGRAILAVARNNGNVTLWSLLEARPRFDVPHPCAASCVSFRPTETPRQSTTGIGLALCEDLLVGDDAGKIYYYSLEWPELAQGSMTLLAKIDAHTQNICGLAWSPDGQQFVSGGNDNRALLFDPELLPETADEHAFSQEDLESGTVRALARNHQQEAAESQMITPPDTPERGGVAAQHRNPNLATPPREDPTRIHGLDTPPPTPLQRGRTPTRSPSTDHRWTPGRNGAALGDNLALVRNALANPDIPGHANMHVYSFYHSAAVKAMAFAPWQPNLLATGGGSNDRQIHFFHTGSGALLALINVFSQVTSLPEHEIRIAVFSWPGCECVVSVPWDRKQNGEVGRALWAIPYPGGPNDAIPSRRQSDSSDGFSAWEAVRQREAERGTANPDVRLRRSLAPSPERTGATARSRPGPWSRPRDSHRRDLRGEGEPWASRTEEEGSLIIACCDQTVKFFEIWAGKSKGKGRGLGNKHGVLGGSRVLEGWCEGVSVDEIGCGEVIR
ncbi:hypothetical protein A1O3_10159 [Capronia epimyces CBS 606.96]|uniref:Uncharacterized protein n=1 Tax=Capronia epimyces CBS 606.96 TaxID=1182542 RepID=W9X957_9EURO|nr:uncharacterized protein A1O3_10159 [Capronia epimyces CBS 606.96]EXJ77002.1 hypothetical protein A1O3_10159 [Capronia epimyces CBS 606.96]